MKEIGIVVLVFVPNNISTNTIDAIYSKKIGFKVLLYSGMVEIILDENEDNLKIHKGDMVILKKQNNYSKKYTEIELFTGDNY